MIEQRLFVFEQKIMTGVELMGFGQAEVRPQQITERTAPKRVAAKPPLAGRANQPIRPPVPAIPDPSAFLYAWQIDTRPRIDPAPAPATA